MINIKTIRLAMPFNFGIANCYLVEEKAGFFLIDTGSSNQRSLLEGELTAAGCQPGNLKLILLTHGDFDHIGNAAYLHHKYAAPVAMHVDDLGMAERGDMFDNRNKPNILIRKLIPLFSGFGKAERFKPQILLKDGDDLSTYGLEARVISIPGHSKGSIGILTASGDLFCGDLLTNLKAPALSAIMDDLPTATASLEKLRGLEINQVYPGHGGSFSIGDVVAR